MHFCIDYTVCTFHATIHCTNVKYNRNIQERIQRGAEAGAQTYRKTQVAINFLKHSSTDHPREAVGPTASREGPYDPL